MSGHIIRLTPENYSKCANIWEMDKNPSGTKWFYDDMVSGNRIIFVYVENGKYIGEAALVLHNDDPDYTIAGKRIYLSRMIVKPECRNHGVAGALLNFLFQYAKQLGYSEISIGVDIINIGARWLYERNGFTDIIFVGEDDGGKYVKLVKKLV